MDEKDFVPTLTKLHEAGVTTATVGLWMQSLELMTHQLKVFRLMLTELDFESNKDGGLRIQRLDAIGKQWYDIAELLCKHQYHHDLVELVYRGNKKEAMDVCKQFGDCKDTERLLDLARELYEKSAANRDWLKRARKAGAAAPAVPAAAASNASSVSPVSAAGGQQSQDDALSMNPDVPNAHKKVSKKRKRNTAAAKAPSEPDDSDPEAEPLSKPAKAADKRAKTAAKRAKTAAKRAKTAADDDSEMSDATDAQKGNDSDTDEPKRANTAAAVDPDGDSEMSDTADAQKGNDSDTAEPLANASAVNADAANDSEMSDPVEHKGSEPSTELPPSVIANQIAFLADFERSHSGSTDAAVRVLRSTVENHLGAAVNAVKSALERKRIRAETDLTTQPPVVAAPASPATPATPATPAAPLVDMPPVELKRAKNKRSPEDKAAHTERKLSRDERTRHWFPLIDAAACKENGQGLSDLGNAQAIAKLHKLLSHRHRKQQAAVARARQQLQAMENAYNQAKRDVTRTVSSASAVPSTDSA